MGAVTQFTYWPVQDRSMAQWMACEFPERPAVLGSTGFHGFCRPCRLVAEAMIRTTDEVWWLRTVEALDHPPAGF